MKTYSAKQSEIQQKWLLIDAENVVLGRLATQVAKILRGKHKPMFTPHLDCGDKVVIINAGKIAITGKKRTDKVYYRHTGFPGGIKETTPEKVLTGRFPERIVKLAVQRMITRGPLGRDQMRNLYVYAGTEHPHQGQNPEVYDFASMNPKNKKR